MLNVNGNMLEFEKISSVTVVFRLCPMEVSINISTENYTIFINGNLTFIYLLM